MSRIFSFLFQRGLHILVTLVRNCIFQSFFSPILIPIRVPLVRLVDKIVLKFLFDRFFLLSFCPESVLSIIL